MFERLIPQKIKSTLKYRIRRLIEQTPYSPTEMKYFPYRWPEQSYSIPKHPPAPEETGFDDLPVPPESLWVKYGKDSYDYLYHGKLHTDIMLEILEKDHFGISAGSRVLDFGCAAGRMTRFLKPFAEESEIWGIDISAAHIYWCRQYLSPPFHFLTNTTLPHLPFEDRYFNLIFSGSVFTHIDDLAEAWVQELRRVLRPGGRLYVTIHDYHTVELMFTVFRERGITNYLKNHPLFQKWREKYGMLVLGRDIDAQVFFDMDYFQKMVSPYFLVKSVEEEAYSYQTAVLLERK